jgi:hypothetical protein
LSIGLKHLIYIACSGFLRSELSLNNQDKEEGDDRLYSLIVLNSSRRGETRPNLGHKCLIKKCCFVVRPLMAESSTLNEAFKKT